MSYATPRVNLKFGYVRREVEDAYESWIEFLTTADRECIADAEEILRGLDSRVRDLRSELGREYAETPTEEGT